MRHHFRVLRKNCVAQRSKELAEQVAEVQQVVAVQTRRQTPRRTCPSCSSHVLALFSLRTILVQARGVPLRRRRDVGGIRAHALREQRRAERRERRRLRLQRPSRGESRVGERAQTRVRAR